MSVLFRLRSIGFICSACLTFLACQSAPAPHETYYRLAPKVKQQSPSPGACGTILVSRLGTHGFAGGRAIVFRDRKDSFEVQRYNYHLWSEPPVLMVQDAIVKALRAAGLTRYVTTPLERTNADWIVSGSLIRLEHFPNASPARVEIEMELGIIAARTRETLLLQRYEESEAAKSNGIEDAVKAFNRALERILSRFQADAGKVLSRERSACE